MTDTLALRRCFGQFMTGVTIVTTCRDDGAPVGFTANSFASVSLEPPLLLVCIDLRSDNLEQFVSGGGFAINILAADQQALSNRFASQVENRFAGLNWHTGAFGQPILGDVAAWLECHHFAHHHAGDHIILIGEVADFGRSERDGLGYVNGRYFTLPGEAGK